MSSPREDQSPTPDLVKTVTADPALLEADDAATGPVPTAEGGDSSDVDLERVARFAEPVESLLRFTLVGWNAAGYAKGIARREMVVADAEQAVLVARVAELEAMLHDAQVRLDEQRRMTDEAHALADRLGERVAYYRDSEVPALRSNADGWAARAEAAEQRERTLRERLEGLAERWVRMGILRSMEGTVSAKRGRELHAALAEVAPALPTSQPGGCIEPVPAPPVTQTSEEGEPE